MLTIDLTGKRCLIAGIADDRGFGFAIAKHFAAAGASVCAAVWPPAYPSFSTMLRLGKLTDRSPLPNTPPLRFERVYTLDARYDDPQTVPPELRDNRRYRELDGFTLADLEARVQADFGPRPLDVVVHCIAHAPDVTKPLLETCRDDYLAAVSASSYSMVALAQRFAPMMRSGGSFLCMSYLAAVRVIPGYGGGMSSAKAALESDTRVLSFELGRRYGLRINCISAGPWASRAAKATGFIDSMVQHVAKSSPIPRPIDADDVGATAVYLASPLARAITGSTLYVDNGNHCMGMAASEA